MEIPRFTPSPTVSTSGEAGIKPPSSFLKDLQDAGPANVSGDQLLITLWRSLDQCHQIGSLDRKAGKFRNHPVKNVDEALHIAQALSEAGVDAYFACAEYKTTDSRTAANVSGAYAFWADIDCGEAKAASGKGYLTEADALVAVKKFCTDAALPMPTHIVSSGSGLHIYWVLDSVTDRETWQMYAGKLKTITKALGFLADDSRTSDIASVLRIPGTLNFKYEPPKPVTQLQGIDTFISQVLMLAAIESAFSKLRPTPVGILRAPTPKTHLASTSTEDVSSYGPPDLEKLTSALTILDPDCDDFTWKFHRIAILAGLAHDHPELHDQMHTLAKEWSSGKLSRKPCAAWTTPGNSNGRTGDEVFDETWVRFFNNPQKERRATVGTIYFHAKEAGWVHQSHFSTSSSQSLLAARNAEDFEVIDGSVQKMSPLQSVQQQYCMINMEGRLWALDLRTHNSISLEGTARKLVVSNLTDGALLVRRTLRGLGVDKDGSFKLSSEFFNNPQTICYDGVEFNPVGSSGNYLNLWVGPTLEPKAGGWTLIRSFLLEIICNNDQVAFDFLIGYLAHALQRPEEKPGIMVIMIGGQGIGKGTFGKILRLIWSATYWHIHKIDDVTGNFNAVLERAFIVFLDEAMFAGDRKASDALKSLVTEPIIQINEKYQPARQTRSYHRFFAATNSEHFKNTERDDRRDFVLKVSEAKKNDHAYWSALNSEIEQGGTAAMMHDLLSMDLSRFKVRAKPSTAALVEQKLLSLGPVERWWQNALSQGDIDGTGTWLTFISTIELIEAVMEFSGGKVFRKPSPVEVLKTMKRLCPSAVNKQQQDTFKRHRGLAFPDLQQARAEFEQYIGGVVNWEEDTAIGAE